MSEEPRKILIVGAGAGLGRELAKLIMRDERLRGQVVLVDKLPEDHHSAHEPVDLDQLMDRLRGELPELRAPVVQRREHNALLPYHGKSKHDRQRKWWNR
jgi:NAD(P)-dependent dehydrogenase (short-subunit alcohol dehydrogenase family)